jgi:hypothetical protein
LQKIAESCEKLRKIAENCGKLRKIAENCGKKFGKWKWNLKVTNISLCRKIKNVAFTTALSLN